MTQFPAGTQVDVRYPRSKQEEHETPRESWPWLPGVIEDECGDDEWLVVVIAREVATGEDGTLAADGTADDDMYYPCCFRDSSEIRPARATTGTRDHRGRPYRRGTFTRRLRQR